MITTFQVCFHSIQETRKFLKESDPDPLTCWWLSPSCLNRVNGWIKRWFAKDVAVIERSVKVHSYDTDKVVAQIVAQRELVAMLYGMRVRSVLIGPPQLDMAHEECMPFMFDVRMDLRGPDGIKIIGLPVEVVPWLDGIIALPKR